MRGDRGLPPPLTEQADAAASTWAVFLVIALATLALVTVLVGYVALRYRKRSDDLPEQVKYRIPIEVAYTVLPLALVVGLFVLTVTTLRTMEADAPEPDVVVEVVAFQWQWQFGYPDAGVTVGGDESSIPELVLPADSWVRFELEARDVIHSFWVPGFLYKRDIIPGTPTSFDVHVNDVDDTVVDGACAEFCGLYHDRMIFTVRIVDRTEFDAWLEQRAAAGAHP